MRTQKTKNERVIKKELDYSSNPLDFQLYYLSENWWAYLDSNQGPTGYEPVALAI
jgi:hypothetical protein